MTETIRDPLDAQVAQHVMHFVFVDGHDGIGPYSLLCSQQYADDWIAKYPRCRVVAKPQTEAVPTLLPCYSTRMDQAWLVVDEMKRRSCWHQKRFLDTLYVECNRAWVAASLADGIKYEDDIVLHPAEVPFWLTPQIICTAALRTMDVAKQ